MLLLGCSTFGHSILFHAYIIYYTVYPLNVMLFHSHQKWTMNPITVPSIHPSILPIIIPSFMKRVSRLQVNSIITYSLARRFSQLISDGVLYLPGVSSSISSLQASTLPPPHQYHVVIVDSSQLCQKTQGYIIHHLTRRSVSKSTYFLPSSSSSSSCLLLSQCQSWPSLVAGVNGLHYACQASKYTKFFKCLDQKSTHFTIFTSYLILR